MIVPGVGLVSVLLDSLNPGAFVFPPIHHIFLYLSLQYNLPQHSSATHVTLLFMKKIYYCHRLKHTHRFLDFLNKCRVWFVLSSLPLSLPLTQCCSLGRWVHSNHGLIWEHLETWDSSSWTLDCREKAIWLWINSVNQIWIKCTVNSCLKFSYCTAAKLSHMVRTELKKVSQFI